MGSLFFISTFPRYVQSKSDSIRSKVSLEILDKIIDMCEEVRRDEARTQKFFSVKDKTRYKTWVSKDYT